jgi:hypothetical protein
MGLLYNDLKELVRYLPIKLMKIIYNLYCEKKKTVTRFALSCKKPVNNPNLFVFRIHYERELRKHLISSHCCIIHYSSDGVNSRVSNNVISTESDLVQR